MIPFSLDYTRCLPVLAHMAFLVAVVAENKDKAQFSIHPQCQAWLFFFSLVPYCLTYQTDWALVQSLAWWPTVIYKKRTTQSRNKMTWFILTTPKTPHLQFIGFLFSTHCVKRTMLKLSIRNVTSSSSIHPHVSFLAREEENWNKTGQSDVCVVSLAS